MRNSYRKSLTCNELPKTVSKNICLVMGIVLITFCTSCSKKHYEDNANKNQYSERNVWMENQFPDTDTRNLPEQVRPVEYGTVGKDRDDSEIHYFGEYHLGYGTTSSVNGNDTYTGNVMLGTIQGIQYQQYFQIGLGADGQMLTHYYKNQSIRYGILGYCDVRGSYPITDDFLVTFGGSFGVSYSLEPSGSNAPFYMEIGPGLIYKRLLFKSGLQKSGSGDGTNHLFVKIGFHF